MSLNSENRFKMKFRKLNIIEDDLNKVARLIYETDAEILNFYFKDKNRSVERIEKLIRAGYNSWGHEFIYVVGGDHDKIFAVLVAYKGEEIGTLSEIKVFFKNLDFLDALKFVLVGIGYMWIGSHLDVDDYYISDLAVDEKCRGRGIGTFILENSLELARDKGCKRVVLDVDPKNEGAKRLYQRFGFIKNNKKSMKWLGSERAFYNMEYEL